MASAMVAVLQPLHSYAPPRTALVNEPQRLLALLAGVGEADVDIVGERAFPCPHDLVQHVGRGAPARERDQRRSGDLVGVRHDVLLMTFGSVRSGLPSLPTPHMARMSATLAAPPFRLKSMSMPQLFLRYPAKAG